MGICLHLDNQAGRQPRDNPKLAEIGTARQGSAQYTLSMGQFQHYVPAHLIGQWGDRRAASLIPDVTEQQEALYRRRAESTSARVRPVSLLQKAKRANEPSRLRAGYASKLMGSKGIYSLTEPTSLFEAGVQRHVLEGGPDRPPRIPPGMSLESFFEAEGRVRVNLDWAERETREIDGTAFDAMERIRAGQRPTIDERAALLRFIAFQGVRTPSYRAANERQMRSIIDASSRPYLGSAPTESIDRFIRTIVATIRRDAFAVLVANTARRAKSLLDREIMRLLVMKATGESRFVLGDNPARPWVENELPTRGTPWPGLAFGSTVCTLPISPDRCLLVTSLSRLRDAEVEVDDATVRRINTAQLILASHHVVLPSPHLDCFLQAFAPLTVPPWIETGGLNIPPRLRV